MKDYKKFNERPNIGLIETSFIVLSFYFHGFSLVYNFSFSGKAVSNVENFPMFWQTLELPSPRLIHSGDEYVGKPLTFHIDYPWKLKLLIKLYIIIVHCNTFAKFSFFYIL